MSFSERINRIRKVLIATGVLGLIFLLGGLLSGLYLRGTSINLECVVEEEKREFILRSDELLTGMAVFKCQNKEGERLCGPITQGKIPVYLYVSSALDSMYFAPKLEESTRENCHSLGLGYSPKFNICVSLDNKIPCSKKRNF